jgi:hypothetical protein
MSTLTPAAESAGKQIGACLLIQNSPTTATSRKKAGRGQHLPLKPYMSNANT